MRNSLIELNTFDDIEKGFNSLYGDVLPIIEDIAVHTKRARKAMDNDPVDTLTISNEQVELSILLQRLGDRISVMGRIARAAEEYRNVTREGHKVRLVREESMAAGVADSMKDALAHKEFQLYNDCQYVLDRLLNARKSTDKTIDTIRSKLSYEKAIERNA